MDNKRLGSFGENIACYYLVKKGYDILDRNYSKKWSAVSKGEIDIVAEKPSFAKATEDKDKTICFIEVKTLSSSFEFFSPEDRVDFQKKRKLIKLAQNWLSEKKIPLDSKWQIDIISIRVNLDTKKAKVKHFKNAVA